MSNSNGNNHNDDRGSNGRFLPGNPGGGNPHAGAQARARAKFYASLRDSDVVAALRVIRRVMKSGKATDQLAAARELLDRTLGKAVAMDLLERIEALEQQQAEARR